MGCWIASVCIRWFCYQVMTLLGYACICGRIDGDGVGLGEALSGGNDMFVLLCLSL